MLLLFFLTYFLLLSLLLHYEAANPISHIRTWGDAIWYSAVTLTTVGYGDVYPISTTGKIIGYVFLLLSLGVYGLLIGQIASVMNSIREHKKFGLHGTKFENHVVIIGWNSLAKTVIDQLIATGRKVAIVTDQKNDVEIIQEYYLPKTVYVLFSDYENFDLLEKANIAGASIIFVNLEDDTQKLVYVLNLKKHFDNPKMIVTLENANLKHTFQSAGVRYAISRHEIASKLLASYIFEPDVAEFSEEIISYATNDEEYDIKQFKVAKDNPFIQSEYGKSFYALKRDYNVILIGLVRLENGERKLYKNPEDQFLIQEKDYLIMIMNRKAEEKIQKIFQVGEGYQH